MVSGSFDQRTGKWWFGLASEDVKIAMQAAHQTADRLNKPVALQSDLSVVPADEATIEVLEVVKPVGYYE
jgi:hypothetical protein